MDCKIIPSVCSYCGTGCGVLFEVMDGELMGTMPIKTHPVNEGKLCIKGWNLHEHVNSFMRLKQPRTLANVGVLDHSIIPILQYSNIGERTR